ncbi:MAG: ATP-binding cassette domain-containing protein, partial [Acutalibacteraceae bacterium]|nr:ATP-binding cassette domain-containing protein [Acutalibacteraceae bacterium]
PKDALDYKIGMVHQHFKLVDVFSATENIILGLDEGKFNVKKSAERIKKISEQYGFDIDPNKKIYEMSVSEKQTVEIIKVLYRGADILILDEPTAVLTPQETLKLFDILRRMRDDGKAIIIITHKLHEVLSLSDRVSVLRKGEYIGTVNTAETNESELTEMMVGKKISLNIDRSDPVDPVDRLIVKDISCINRDGVKLLDDISFTARSGEILGIAGIAGSGQRELLESIAGLQHLNSGEIMYNNPKTGGQDNLRDKTPMQIRELGVRLSFVPEDRLGMGLVGNMDIVDNMMLRSYRKGKGAFLERKKPKTLAEKVISDLEVVTPSANTPVRRLSGGNVQKVLVGREIASSPTVFMAAYPVRGLDINSSYLIYNLLNEQKEKGVAVIFVGEDLDVLLELCDRILVINSGKITGLVDARTSTKEELGLLMTKTDGGETHE